MRGSRGIARVPAEFRGARDVVIGGRSRRKKKTRRDAIPAGLVLALGVVFS
jgi:hypothetical protein